MADLVSVRINEILQSLSPISAEVCIFRVPNFLREVNKKAYEPQVLAIGPFHDHGKDHLKAMEAHKIQYLQLLLKERWQNDVSIYVTKMRELEEKARKCYAEPVSLDSDDFVKMMLLDGCFIVQLIRMRFKYQLRDPNDLVFKVRSLFKAVCLDLLLVENQLPFFVIWELYSMLEIRDQYSFKKRVFEFFSFVLPKKLHPREDWKSIEEINHLLHFIHHCSHHDPTNSNKNRNQSVRWHSIGCTMKLEEAGIKNMNQSDRWNSVGCATKLEEAGIKNMNQSDWNSIGCATKLEEAGMKFEMSEGNSLFDIRFESGSGTMKIPLITVDDSTEGFLRNHVAFEQIHPGEKLHHVTDFLVFMDYLIDSAKDVEILRQHKIIENMLGDNEAVATMFNRLGHHVGFSSKDFYYSQVFNQMNHYCSRCQRWKKFIAYLKRNYFNSPWAPLVSVVAAFTLLLLAVLQTLYTILSYTKQNA